MLYAALSGNERGDEKLAYAMTCQPLRAVLQQLSRDHHINFIYNDALIDNIIVAYKPENESPCAALKKILKPYPFAYEFLSTNTVLIRPSHQGIKSFRLIRGCVKDAETGEPLVDANAYIPGNHIGSATDARGQFALAVPDSTTRLAVSYIGYETKIQKISSISNVLDIQLNPGVFQFNSIRIMAPSFSEEIEQISRTQLNEENFIGVIASTPTTMTYASFMSYNDNSFYSSSSGDQTYYYIKITGNRLQPMLGSDRNNRLSFHQNQVQINGMNLQMPFHTTIIPAMNPGIVDYDLIQQSRYQTTVFDVAYGDAYESVMDVRYRKGNATKIGGKVKVDLTNSSFFLEGSLAKKASWLVHGKKSHMNNILSTMHRSKWMGLDYKDLQAQLDFQPAEQHAIRVTAIHSEDQIAFDPEINYIRERLLSSSSTYSSTGTIQAEESVHEMNYDDNKFLLNTLSIDGQSQLGENWKSELMVTYGDQRYRNTYFWSAEHTIRFPPERSDSTYNYLWSEGTQGHFKVRSWQEKFVLSHTASSAYSMKAGFHFEQARYAMTKANSLLVRIQESVSQPASYNRTRDNTQIINKYAWFYQEDRRLSARLHVQAGLRYDRFSLQSKGRFNPRAIVRYAFPWQMTTQLALGTFSRLSDFGEMRQHLLKRLESTYKAGDSEIEFQTVRKIQIGVEKTFSSLFSLDGDYFYEEMDNLIPIQRLSDGSLFYTVEERAQAFRRGFDMHARLNSPVISLTGHYKFTDSHEQTPEAGEFPYLMDQRHALSLSIHAALPKDWSIGLQTIYGSGYAYTSCILPEYDWDLGYDRDSTPIWEFDTDHPNSSWYPAYHRLDISFKKGFYLPFGKMSLAVNFINVLNTRHTFTYIYTYDQNGEPIRQSESLVPFFPQVELAYEF